VVRKQKKEIKAHSCKETTNVKAVLVKLLEQYFNLIESGL
jgi:hypothetical protein